MISTEFSGKPLQLRKWELAGNTQNMPWDIGYYWSKVQHCIGI